METSTWKDIKKELPQENEFIVYSEGNDLFVSYGRYCGLENPMPSIPKYMNWEKVKFWFSLPKFPMEG